MDVKTRPSGAALEAPGALFIKNIVEQLLDLSRRNPSLNFRPAKAAILFPGSPEAIAQTISLAGVPVASLMSEQPTAEQLKILRRLSDRSKLLAEERGVQVLHIALGLFRWNDDKTGKSYNAPIMLLPVELARSGEAYTVKRIEGEEPEPNRALLELFRRNPSVRYKEFDLSNEMTYAEIAASFAAALPAGADMDLTHECHLGLFSYEKLVMVEDIESSAESILVHPVICALNGDPEPLALIQHGIESPTLPDLDQAATNPNRVYVTEADSSQQEALESVARGMSLVVQGPPGTGKSQTIVNLIAQAIFDGKSVLFVAEKKVALDVVFDRLAERGLSDAMLAVQRDADKKRFAAMLGARHAELASVASSDSPFKPLESALTELDAYRRELHAPVGASGDAPFNLYGRQARFIGETPPIRIDRVECFDRDHREQLADAVERLASNPSWLRNPNEAVWASLRPEVNDLGLIHAARDDMVEGQRLASEITSILSVASRIVGPHDSTSDVSLDLLESLLRLVATSPSVPAQWLTATPDVCEASLQRYIVERKDYEQHRESLLTRYRSDVFDADIDELAERFIGEYERFWKRWFSKTYTQDVKRVLQQRLENHRKVVFAELRQELDSLRSDRVARQTWDNPAHELHVAFGNLFRGVDTSPDYLDDALQWFKRFAESRERNRTSSVLARTLTSDGAEIRREALVLADRLSIARAALNACAASLGQLLQDLPSERASWAHYLTEKLDAMEEAPRYCQYRRWISEIRASGCGRLLDVIHDDENIEPDHWRTTFDRVFDASLIDYAHRTRPVLAAFDRENHERLRNRYAGIDEGNVSSGGRRVLHRLADTARARMNDQAYREAIDVVIKEASKSRNVMPIRLLTRRAFEAIRVLKPCWMMSPLAVSQYLPAGQVFDLVVFDEASQMRPADAIPALTRGRQVVVVGDNKQLPPSNFFDNAINIESESDEDEDRADIADYESILDRCSSVVQQRMLRWHYRSRDESLIAFSNEHFYDGRLVTFPTPAKRVGLGVRLVKSASTYARGGTRQNRGEAADIAELAYHHARTRSNETLGIIAFSQAQQRAIEDALERMAESDPSTAVFFSGTRPVHERVFVKNLESVQGDERDVIILSVGYGKDEDGKLSYNFGPLNRAGGGRRLNVAVTRAKNEMILVSSIDDRDLDAEKCRDGGPFLIRSYLAYARAGGSSRGAVHATGRGVDSPFEEDVRLVLTSAGHKVHLQVGASGYRIDLAVQHPEREGEYVLAVECDGATYHGTPTARDRDRLRDRTLQTFGWRIHRIWSRDWFRRRSDEIARLNDAIVRAIEASDSQPAIVLDEVPQPAVPEPRAHDERTRMMLAATNAVYGFLDRDGLDYAKKEIADGTVLPDTLVGSALDLLIGERCVLRLGVGRGTRYRRCNARAHI